MRQTRYEKGKEQLKQIDGAGGENVIHALGDIAPDAPLGYIQLHSYATSHNTEYHPYAISHNTKMSSVLRLGEDHPCALYGLTGRLQYSQ